MVRLMVRLIMNKQDIVKRELTTLDNLANNFVSKVIKELQDIRKDDVKLYLTNQDKYRLLVLKTWTVRYQVSLKYILETLLPFWELFIKRRSKKMLQRGLNVRVSTLTGKKSEQILIECIKRDFPTFQNQRMYISEEQDRIIHKYLMDTTDNPSDGIKVKTDKRGPTSIRRYVKSYKSRIKKESRLREQLIERFQERPYRTNPFI